MIALVRSGKSDGSVCGAAYDIVFYWGLGEYCELLLKDDWVRERLKKVSVYPCCQYIEYKVNVFGNSKETETSP